MTIVLPLIAAFLLIGWKARSLSLGVYLLMLLIIVTVTTISYIRD